MSKQKITKLIGGYFFIDNPVVSNSVNEIVEDYIDNAVDLLPSLQLDTITKKPYVSRLHKKIKNKYIRFEVDNMPIRRELYLDSNNPFYKPLLSHSDPNINENIFLDDDKKMEQLPEEQQKLMMEKLKNFETILPYDIFLPVNKSVAINNLIVDVEDEINEGVRMKKYIMNMIGHIFSDIIIKIHRGYLYVVRSGAKVNDILTKKMVPFLKYFMWQENKPINYTAMKNILFADQTQDQEQRFRKMEAEAIVSSEYIIGIQCKSEYQLWCLKRLLMIWYSDPDLFYNIRKIKLLINHYRADGSQEYNDTNGVLPMIVIYPKYGIDNARILLSKLEYYFSLYTEDNYNKKYPSIFLTNSAPTYFLKKNNILYYTNGSINLNMYIKELKAQNKQTKIVEIDDIPSDILIPSN